MRLKKIMAGLAAMTMVLSPLSVCAQENSIVAQSADGATIYTNYSDAWDDAQNGTKIVMLADWDLTDRLVLDKNKKAEIEMNGHKIWRYDWTYKSYTHSGKGEVIYMGAESELILTGNTASSTSFDVTKGIKTVEQVEVVSGGLITGGSSGGNGGGIHMEKSTHLTLENIAVAGNNAVYDNANGGDGGGININNADSTLTLKNALIEYNYSVENGGGICVEGDNATITLDNSKIDNNQARKGGGIYSDNEGTKIELKNNSTIDNNVATSNGGGIYFENTDFSVKTTDDDVTTSQNTISNNQADNGGGIYVEQEEVGSNSGEISNIKFDSNTATEEKGGALYIEQENVKVSNCTITKNVATTYGGGIYIYNDGLTVQDCTIFSNTASSGGGIYVNENEDITLAGVNKIQMNGRPDHNADDIMLEKTWLHTAYIKGEIKSGSKIGIRTGTDGTTQIGKDITNDPGDALYLDDGGNYHIEYKDNKLYKSDGSILGSIFGNANLGMAVVVMAGITVVGVVCLVVNKKKQVK